MKEQTAFGEVQREAVETTLRNRIRNFRLSKKAALREEASFLSGAASVLQALYGDPESGELTSAVPPAWIILPMSGRSVFETEQNKGKRNG